MARTNTIQLVAITGSDNDAERLVSLFRSAGRVARVQRPDSCDELAVLLADPQDLIIIDASHSLPPAEALAQCRQLAPQVSVILITDEDITPWFRAGAADVVSPSDPQRLVAAGLREVEHTRLHHRLAVQQQELQAAEQRNALLLAESEEAIAYMADGMIIHANDRFAERFGFADAAALDCASIVDLIAPGELDKVRAMMKAPAHSGTAHEFEFQGRHAEGTLFAASMQLCASTYDGEDCIQVKVAEPGPQVSSGAVDIDPLTGLASRQRLEAELAAQLTQRSPGGNHGTLIYFGIDDFQQLRARHGLRITAELIRGVSTELAALVTAPILLAACGEDGFACLLPEPSADTAASLAQQYLAELASRHYPTSTGNLQCSLSAGVAALIAAEEGAALLDQAFQAAQQAREAGGGGEVGVYRPSLQERAAGSADDLDRALAEALEEDRLALTFQPIISLRASGGEHYEVRVEPRNEEDREELHGLLSMLDRSGHHTRLDRWVILEATKLLAEQRARGRDTRLLINLTDRVLEDQGLPAWLGVVLKAGTLPAEALTLQLAADRAGDALQATRRFAESMQQLGCRFSLAGFGAQERAQALFEQIPVDWIHLDDELCRSRQSPEDQGGIRHWVTAAAERSVKVIVTGVDNAAMLALLWQAGADYIQGNYLQAPSREMDYEFTDIA